MSGQRTKLRILLSVVALAQILTIPVISGQTDQRTPTALFHQFGHEQILPLSTPFEAHRKQRIKRASAERRAADQMTRMAHSCQIAAHSST